MRQLGSDSVGIQKNRIQLMRTSLGLNVFAVAKSSLLACCWEQTFRPVQTDEYSCLLTPLDRNIYIERAGAKDRFVDKEYTKYTSNMVIKIRLRQVLV